MIEHGYNDNMDLLPTMMSVAKIYFEIIKKNVSEGVFALFVKAVSTQSAKKRTQDKKERKKEAPKT